MTEHSNRTMYWIIGGVVVALAIIGFFTYNGGPDDRQATRKAEELAQKFEQAGLRVPADLQLITHVLGTDGGAVCARPVNSLRRAVLFDQLTNGANVGRRPVIVDGRILLGEALILETYCPDRLEDFRDAVDELKTDDTIKD